MIENGKMNQTLNKWLDDMKTIADKRTTIFGEQAKNLAEEIFDFMAAKAEQVNKKEEIMLCYTALSIIQAALRDTIVKGGGNPKHFVCQSETLN